MNETRYRVLQENTIRINIRYNLRPEGRLGILNEAEWSQMDRIAIDCFKEKEFGFDRVTGEVVLIKENDYAINLLLKKTRGLFQTILQNQNNDTENKHLPKITITNLEALAKDIVYFVYTEAT